MKIVRNGYYSPVLRRDLVRSIEFKARELRVPMKILNDRIVELAIQEARSIVGKIRIDESYFGTKRIWGKLSQRQLINTGLWSSRAAKASVFVCRAKLLQAELIPALQGRIVEGGGVYTDGLKAYDCLVANGYRRHSIH